MAPPSLRAASIVIVCALALALSLALSAGPTLSTAQAQQIGTAFSGPSTADGASAWINPAAMNAGTGTHIELDAGLALLSVKYAPDNGLTPTSASPIGPLLTLGGYTAAIHPDLRVGLSMGVPQTQGGKWDRAGGAADITRYYMADGALFHISITPAVSYAPAPWISIGVAANIVYGNLTMDLDKDLGASLNQTAGSADLNSPFPYAHPDLAAPILGVADGVGIGVIGGVHVRPIEELSAGVSVHSPVSINGSGALSVEYPERLQQVISDLLPSATLPDLNGSFDVDLSRPLIVIGGVSVRPIPELEIGVIYQYENTSSQPNFNIVITEATSESIENTTKPQAYTDRHRVALRVAAQVLPELRLAFYGSVQSNTIPDLTLAPNNIDFDRYEIGLAARWQVVDEFSVMLQYTHVFLGDRVITESLHRPVTQPSLSAFNHPSPTGAYTGSAETIRLGLATHF